MMIFFMCFRQVDKNDDFYFSSQDSILHAVLFCASAGLLPASCLAVAMTAPLPSLRAKRSNPEKRINAQAHAEQSIIALLHGRNRFTAGTFLFAGKFQIPLRLFLSPVCELFLLCLLKYLCLMYEVARLKGFPNRSCSLSFAPKPAIRHNPETLSVSSFNFCSSTSGNL